jgi:hypothetical protein
MFDVQQSFPGANNKDCHEMIKVPKWKQIRGTAHALLTQAKEAIRFLVGVMSWS